MIVTYWTVQCWLCCTATELLLQRSFLFLHLFCLWDDSKAIITLVFIVQFCCKLKAQYLLITPVTSSLGLNNSLGGKWCVGGQQAVMIFIIKGREEGVTERGPHILPGNKPLITSIKQHWPKYTFLYICYVLQLLRANTWEKLLLTVILNYLPTKWHEKREVEL